MDHQQLNVRVPSYIAAGIDQIATAEMRPRSSAARVLLAEALERR